MMGPGIAGALALGGVRATILSRTAEGAARGLETARRQLRLPEESRPPIRVELRALGSYGGSRAAASTRRSRAWTGDRIGIRRTWSSSRSCFNAWIQFSKPDAVLASNTSGLSITSVASLCGRPERVLTTHFWNPPHLMPLVEIVKGEKTSAGVAAPGAGAAREVREDAGDREKDRRAVGEPAQMALVREAVHIVAEGVADVEDVDLVVKSGFGLRLPVYGVFEHQDMVGLDMALSIVDYVSQDLYNEPRAPELMRRKVAEGELGVKTGRGFYDWSRKSAEDVKARRDRFVLEFLRAEKARQG